MIHPSLSIDSSSKFASVMKGNLWLNCCNTVSFESIIIAGHPALIGRHAPFPVTHQAAERWLHHMQQALDSTMSIDPNSKVKMMNFFRHISTHTVSSFVDDMNTIIIFII